MGGAIGIFLISAAAGYWVLARSSSEQGWIKTLGRVMGMVIILISFLSIPPVLRQTRVPANPFARPGAFPAPGVQFRRPSATPEFSGGLSSKPAAEKETPAPTQ